MKLALAALALAAASCAAPPPPQPAPAAPWYDAGADVIHYDDPTFMANVQADWGDPGVEWIQAHEEGHQAVQRKWLADHVALWTLMPGPGARVQIEQVAQCWAKAKLGHGAPWQWPNAEATGLWDCPDALAAEVAAA